MPAPWKPDGYPSVSPYLVVAGASTLIDFLERAFGATRLRRFDRPDGTVMHAEVRIGDSVVMVGDGGESWPPVPASLHVYVEDVDAATRARSPPAASRCRSRPARTAIPIGAAA
jgi:uncharacterized glyoxalase superfamily protein PhnB